MPISYLSPDSELRAEAFIALAQVVWPGDYAQAATQAALDRTLNVTAWDGERLIGCARVLSDGYFFGTIPEILVDPAYQGQGIGRGLMERAWELSPTGLFFGAQPGREGFFEKLGYTRTLAGFSRHKARPC